MKKLTILFLAFLITGCVSKKRFNATVAKLESQIQKNRIVTFPAPADQTYLDMKPGLRFKGSGGITLESSEPGVLSFQTSNETTTAEVFNPGMKLSKPDTANRSHEDYAVPPQMLIIKP